MTRIQKKCLVVSLCCHGVIMGAIVVSAALRSEPAITTDQILTIIPPSAILTDRQVTTGQHSTTPPRPAPPVTHPTPPPVDPSPTKPTLPETHPLPRVTETPSSSRRNTRTAPDETKMATTKTAPELAPKKQHEITPTFDAASGSGKNSTKSSSSPTSNRSNVAENNQHLSKQIEEAFSSLNNSLNSKEGESKAPSLPAADNGEAFVNYRTFIVNAYYNAWITPDDATHRTSSAIVKIVVARDGSIVSAEITKPSGDTRIDRSVQRALDSVKSLPGFPAGATDAQRTFNIRFNLDAKESAG